MTPAEVARATLDRIEAERAAFRMETWIEFPDESVESETGLSPDQSPVSCGTTLCAAGMIAHMLGWKIHSFGDLYKDGEAGHSIESVAREALGLDHHDAGVLFYSSEETALNLLDDIAQGRTFGDRQRSYGPGW